MPIHYASADPNYYGDTGRRVPFEPSKADGTNIEPWICLRFCNFYDLDREVAHDNLVRSLLFDSFSTNCMLPSKTEVKQTVRLVTRLRAVRSMVLEKNSIWNEVAVILYWRIIRQNWFDGAVDTHLRSFFKSTPELRGRMFFLADSLHKSTELWGPWRNTETQKSFNNLNYFLMDPALHFPDAPDVVAIQSHLKRSRPPQSLRQPQFFCADYPVLDKGCNCTVERDCIRYSRLLSRSHDLRDKFENSSRVCETIRNLWEPLLDEAWQFIRALKERYRLPYGIFSDQMGDLFLKSSLLDALSRCAVSLDWLVIEDLSTALEVVALVRLYQQTTFMNPGRRRMCRADGLGIFIPLSRDADQPVLISGGGWLIDNANVISTVDYQVANRIHLDCPGDSLDLIGLTRPGDIRRIYSVCFPNHPRTQAALLSDLTSHIQHEPLANETLGIPSASQTDPTIKIHVILRAIDSNQSLITIDHTSHPSGALQVTLVAECNGQRFVTWSRPDIHVGRECEHKAPFEVQEHCAISGVTLLSRIGIESSALQEFWKYLFEGKDLPEKDSDGLKKVIRADWESRLSPLVAIGAPLERNRMLIVRCDEDEEVANAVSIVAAHLGKRVYVINRKECWNCALNSMLTFNFCLGLALHVSGVTSCERCEA